MCNVKILVRSVKIFLINSPLNFVFFLGFIWCLMNARFYYWQWLQVVMDFGQLEGLWLQRNFDFLGVYDLTFGCLRVDLCFVYEYDILSTSRFVNELTLYR